MVNSELSETSYIIQAGVTEYPIGFEYHFNENNSPQFIVKIGESVAIINVDFQLSSDGSKIILIPTEEPNWMDKIVGKELLITRDIPLVQTSDYSVGRINPEQIEYDFDNAVMRDQMLEGEISHAKGELGLLNSRIDVVRAEHARDMDTVNAEVATKATKAELEIVKNTLNSHTNELTTLSENQAALGNRVSGVEEKIPVDASSTNQLVAKGTLNDYVKKSGDTMTGFLTFEHPGLEHPTKHVIHGGHSFSIEYYYNNEQYPRETWNFSGASFFASTTTVNPYLGTHDHPWNNIFSKKLNNGADLIVPTEGGTIARMEDINAVVGDISTALTAILGE